MKVWRIASARYPKLDGEGARVWGGRWNSPGRPVVYTASTASLAVLETLVWLDPEDVPADLILYEITLPESVTPAHLRPADLPEGWAVTGSPACIEAGDRWLTAGTSAALAVPSAILPEESNVLLNPRHPDARRARVRARRPFSFDVRLIK
ncbi:MAG: RES family NAD+ phosphorylase [Gemmatimonadaceae bacterium]